MTLTDMERLWELGCLLHETRRNLAWGFKTDREPWPEFSTAYSHAPIAYVDLALAQAKAVDEYIRGKKE